MQARVHDKKLEYAEKSSGECNPYAAAAGEHTIESTYTRRDPVTTPPAATAPKSTAPPVPMHKCLSGQKARVTGANSGIGRGVAIGLAQAGADVLVNYVSGDEAANAVVEEIRQFGVDAFVHKADVSSENQVADMFAAIRQRFGTIDILINNAGLQRDAAFTAMSL